MTETNTLIRAGMTPAERCRYVADLIEQHPENFGMEWFVGIVLDDNEYDADEDPHMVEGEFRAMNDGWRPDLTDLGCGTTCCIAGWAVAVTPPAEVGHDDDLEGAADRLLGLDGDGPDLFYDMDLSPGDAAFLLRWHADELDRA